MKSSASAIIIRHLNNKNKVKVLHAVLGFLHNLTAYMLQFCLQHHQPCQEEEEGWYGVKYLVSAWKEMF